MQTGTLASGVATGVMCASLVLAAASCGGGDDDDAEAEPRRVTTTEPAETTTTLDPAEAEKAAVIDAYEAAIKAEQDSAAPPAPDPNHPAVAETHTGYMLDYWVSGLEGLKSLGNAERLPENSQHRIEVDSVKVEDVEGKRVAYLEVCFVSDLEQINVDTGKVLSGGVWTNQRTEAMVNEGGVWKYAEHRSNTTWEGVAGCAAD